MFERMQTVWLPRLLFVSTLAVAGMLALGVLAAPWLREQLPRSPLVQLFAEEMAVRRTALASAVGLAVTALVFFRPRPAPPVPKKPPRNAPPKNIAGA